MGREKLSEQAHEMRDATGVTEVLSESGLARDAVSQHANALCS